MDIKETTGYGQYGVGWSCEWARNGPKLMSKVRTENALLLLQRLDGLGHLNAQIGHNIGFQTPISTRPA